MLTVYLRKPLFGVAGINGETRDWRVDAIPLPPLPREQRPATDAELEDFSFKILDRQERTVPVATLRSYDVERGLLQALDAARHAGG